MNKFVRLFVSAVVFLIFGWATTVFISHGGGLGEAMWAAGVYGLPAVLLVVFFIDSFLLRLNWFSNRLGVLAVIDCLLAVALYVPGLFLLWLVIFPRVFV